MKELLGKLKELIAIEEGEEKGEEEEYEDSEHTCESCGQATKCATCGKKYGNGPKCSKCGRNVESSD